MDKLLGGDVTFFNPLTTTGNAVHRFTNTEECNFTRYDADRHRVDYGAMTHFGP